LIDVLKTLHKLGLDKTEPVNVKGPPGLSPGCGGPEVFDAVPFLELLGGEYASSWGLAELSEPR
jgi:hypothetical protein